MLNQPYKRSQFSHCLKKGETYCLYHTLSMQKIYGEEILNDIFLYFRSYEKPIDLFQRKYGDNDSLFPPILL